MAHSACKSMEVVRYILTPEISPEPDRNLGASIYPEPLKKRLMGIAKTVFWIFISIILSLALAQLH